MDSSTIICWTSPFVILGVLSLFCHFYCIFDGKYCYVASNLGLHRLPMTRFRFLGKNGLIQLLCLFTAKTSTLPWHTDNDNFGTYFKNGIGKDILITSSI